MAGGGRGGRLNLVFTEASLELVPREILRHPSVRRNAKRRGKPPAETLLNRSLHHFAMKGLPGAEKRGRPDILQICLLLALGSPLNKLQGLRVFAHTLGGLSLFFDPSARLPRDCNRFNSLMEQLLARGAVPPKGPPIVRARRQALEELLREADATHVVLLSSRGRPSSLEEVAQELLGVEGATVLIGAYAQGAPSEEVVSVADEVYSIYPEVLEAWTVTARMVYEYEKAWLALHVED